MAKKATNTTATETAARKRKQEVVGEVVSDKMDKTISVQVYHTVRHKKYGKFIRKSSVFKAHDEKGVAKLGDRVRIYEVRPMSKTKRWMLAEVVEARKTAQGVEV